METFTWELYSVKLDNGVSLPTYVRLTFDPEHIYNIPFDHFCKMVKGITDSITKEKNTPAFQNWINSDSRD